MSARKSKTLPRRPAASTGGAEKRHPKKAARAAGPTIDAQSIDGRPGHHIEGSNELDARDGISRHRQDSRRCAALLLNLEATDPDRAALLSPADREHPRVRRRKWVVRVAH